MKPGIYDIPDDEYFAYPALNHSGAKAILQSPAHYKWQLANPKEPTPAMIDGKAMHCAILEPEAFMDRYAILPDNAPLRPTDRMLSSPNQKPEILERIQFWSVFDNESMGKEVISNEKAVRYQEIGRIVRQHHELRGFFTKGFAERAVFGNDPETGVLCKCKPDYLTEVNGYRIMLEVKSSDNVQFQFFQRTAYNYGYFTASAFYTDLMEWAGLNRPDLYLIVAFERDPPFGVKIYEIPEEAIEWGRRRCRAAINLYAECLERDHWPNYDTTIDVLTLPTWAKG